eukprot:8213436-Lingulodinium_polyedra.AAC.1
MAEFMAVGAGLGIIMAARADAAGELMPQGVEHFRTPGGNWPLSRPGCLFCAAADACGGSG